MAEKLLPGTHSVDRVKPTFNERLDAWTLRFRVRFRDGRVSDNIRVQAKTKGEARRRARAKAESLLRTSGTSKWTYESTAINFLDTVVSENISSAALKGRTKQRYKESLAHIRTRSTGRSLGALTRPSTLKSIIKSVSEEVGVESARQVRSVLSAYVIQAMLDQELMDHNPLLGQKLSYTTPKRREKQTPSLKQWQRISHFVIHEDDRTAPMPGKTSPQAQKTSARARHRRVAELTALQMATGLRLTEALGIVWADVSEAEGLVWITVNPDLSKTGVGRTVPILIPDVADWLLLNRRSSAQPVIPQPTDENKRWDRTGATRAVADYYDGMAERLSLPILNEVRSHVWRSVLNTMTAGRLDADTRAAYFGHTTAMNRRSYTDHVNVRPMADAVKALSAENLPSNLPSREGMFRESQ